MKNGDARSIRLLLAYLVEEVLRLSENPGKCGRFLSEKIRELIAVRMVSLLRFGPDQPTAPPPDVLGASPERKRAVLAPETLQAIVVEDEVLIRIHTINLLNTIGIDVVGQTAYGEEVLPLVDGCHPDLVLMDVRLAGRLSGVEAAALLRGHGDVSVLYTSGYNPETDFPVESNPRVIGFVSKPLDKFMLSRALVSILPLAEN